MLGGGMRQAGVLAAAGLVAIADFNTHAILEKDHSRARLLATKIKVLDSFQIDISSVESNILIVKLNERG